MSKKSIENLKIQETLRLKLNYPDTKNLIILDDSAPNSCVIHDSKTSRVWKVLRNNPNNTPWLELSALNKLSSGSKYVLKHIDNGELKTSDEQSYFYFVFPHIEGMSLDKKIEQFRSEGKHFSYDEIVKVADCITRGIAELNMHSIVHQDVKPGNIIVKHDNTAILIDLGLARFIQYAPRSLKKLEGPYAYMSPEKLGILTDGKLRNWAKINWACDLFSLGLILLEMATLKRANGELSDISELYKIYEIVPGLSIDQKLKDLIFPYLLPSQFDRQMRVSEKLSVDWFGAKQSNGFRLWLHSDKNSCNLYESFISEHKFKSPFGLLYKAEQIISEKGILTAQQRGNRFKELGGAFALDPCTYLLRYENQYHRGTAFFSYGEELIMQNILQISKFTPNESYTEVFCKNVVDEQNKLGTTIIISPYLYINSIDSDEIEANFRFWKLTQDYIEKTNISQPVYFAVLLSENLLKSERDVKELIHIIASQRYAKNIYIRTESKRQQSNPVTDRDWLQNLGTLIKTISKTANVLLASGGIESLGYLSYGLDEISTNPFFSQRKFSIDDKITTRSGGSQPDPRYFVRKLMNEVLVNEELNSGLVSLNPSLQSVIQCSCGYCPHRDKESLAKHYLAQFDDMFLSLISKNRNEMKTIYSDWLQVAEESYDAFESAKVQFETYSGGAFIPIWKQVF